MSVHSCTHSSHSPPCSSKYAATASRSPSGLSFRSTGSWNSAFSDGDAGRTQILPKYSPNSTGTCE
jgi:hypothetical protein